MNAAFDNMEELKCGSKLELLNEMQPELPNIFDGVRLDGVTINLGFEYLKEKSPRILYLAFDETDDFVHGGRYSDYLNSAYYTDDFLRKLRNWVQHNPAYKDKNDFTCYLLTRKRQRLCQMERSWK